LYLTFLIYSRILPYIRKDVKGYVVEILRNTTVFSHAEITSRIISKTQVPTGKLLPSEFEKNLPSNVQKKVLSKPGKNYLPTPGKICFPN